MSQSDPLAGSLSAPIDTLVKSLDSLIDGELAVDLLIACGKQAIGPLENLLLNGKPRTIAIPRCRAVRALGGLEAREPLRRYLEALCLPEDPAILFAEDAVRSAVARELLRWRDEEVFQTLLGAATQRATVGLIESLGEFGRSEAIPVLFERLEDDFCSAAALKALLKTPEEAHQYAILSIRQKTQASLRGAGASRRRRKVAELLLCLEISREEWQDILWLLDDDDAAVVLCIASVGFRVALQEEFPGIVRALFRVAHKVNWLQEDDLIRLLDEHKDLAYSVAKQVLSDLRARGKNTNWLSPTWRILHHLERFGDGQFRV